MFGTFRGSYRLYYTIINRSPGISWLPNLISCFEAANKPNSQTGLQSLVETEYAMVRSNKYGSGTPPICQTPVWYEGRATSSKSVIGPTLSSAHEMCAKKESRVKRHSLRSSLTTCGEAGGSSTSKVEPSRHFGCKREVAPWAQ